MNGLRMSNSSRGSSHTRNESFAAAIPPTRVLVDGYSSAPHGLNGGSYRDQPRSYGAFNTNDSVSMHLLMENALGDSKTYDVLSPDDVDSIKRELSVLASRIEATQRKLVLETKVRDAAHSMGRLQKPGMTNGAGRSSEEAEEAARKCDELGRELWMLEKQEHQVTRLLLEHNAAILQMTHKGFLKDKADAGETGMSNGFGEFAYYKPSSLSLDDFAFGDSSSNKQQGEAIIGIGRRVDELNLRIRDMIRETQIQKPNAARGMQSDPSNPDLLHEQIDFLETNLDIVQLQSESAGSFNEDIQMAEDSLQNLNYKLYQNLNRLGAALSEPPDPDGKSLPSQVEYLSTAFGNIIQHLDKSERYETTIQGLWTLLATPQEADDFSLQRLSAKVQEMQVKFSGLQEQKDVLARQVQQQRELNESSDHAKDGKMQNLADQLEETRAELESTRKETNAQIEKLTSAMEELDAAKTKIAQAQAEQERVQAASQELEQEREARKKTEELLQKAKADAEKADESAKEMEAKFIHAQTELTITKAELDSAHGSRAERAAEIAGDPVLQARIQKLETELNETISDYEAMTKSTIEYEKEREQFESTIDGLREKVETLESQLSEERVSSLGSTKSPSQSSERGGSAGTSASVLRSEFRKMMKDQRVEHIKALKAEQEERRKLEATIRALKKEQLQPRNASK